MNRTSLMLILMLGATWTVACGDDSSGDDSVTDAGTADDSSGDETSASEDTASETGGGTSEPTEPAETETESPVTDTDTDATETSTATPTDGTETDSTASDSTETDGTETETDGTETETDGTETDSTASDGTDTETGSDEPLDGGVNSDTDVPDASTEDPDASVDPTDPSDGGTGDDGLIGETGGVVSNADGVVLVVPPNSISTPAVISVEAVTPSNQEGLVSGAYDFSPDGLTFDPPATLTIPFEGASSDVVIAWLDGDEWVPLTECEVDGDEITCEVTHFTTFAVIGRGVDGGTECPSILCLESLPEGCTPEDECTIEGIQSTNTEICWTNGVSAEIAVTAGFPVSTTVQTWRNDQNLVCFVHETTSTTTIDGSDVTVESNIVWKGPEGNILATQTVDTEAGTTTITCANDGSTYTLTNGSQCDPSPQGGETCSQGTCP